MLAVLLTIFLFTHANANTTEHTKVEFFVKPLNLHDDWQQLLKMHVKTINNGHSTVVDYAGLQQQQAQLQVYLERLSQVSQREFDSWHKTQQLAFLINAYNAWTIALILTKYPKLTSIKDLGYFFRSPWNKVFIPLLGKNRSLNDIEHDLIRNSGRYNDPRIHFAVNCASIGCPALREEAYTATQLERQLTEQTQRFLTDKTRNYIKKETLYLSSLFKWYGDDFKSGFRGAQSIEAFLLLYASSLTLTDIEKLALSEHNLPIIFLDYNWMLNAKD